MPSCGPPVRKNGTSAPSPAASSCSALGGQRLGSVSFASRSAVAASELPPPRPAATGIRFSIRARQRGSTPRPPRARRARRGRACRPRSRRPERRAPARARSGRRGRRAGARSRPRASRLAAGPTTSARLIFAGARAPVIASASASATNSCGLERLGPRRGGRGRSRPAPPRAARATARPASATEFGSVLRRCANAASTTRLTPAKSSGSATRRKATSAESTFGGGRNTVRETGWKPVRSAASCTSTETAPYAFVLGPREQAVGDLALHHHAPGSTLGSPSRLSTTSGVATLYGQVRDELRRRRARARRGRAASASPKCRSTFVATASARRDAARASGRARRRARARRARRGSAVSTPRPGPTSSTTSSASSSASRPITPRMFSSTRKCWPSSLLGCDRTLHGRPNAARGVRVDLRAELGRRPRRGPRRALRA